jgi:glucosylceramidase
MTPRMTTRHGLALLAISALAACSASDDGAGPQEEEMMDPIVGQSVQVFQTSRAGDKLTDRGVLAVNPTMGASGTVVEVDLDAPRQEILGFGGALTESSASVLATLPAATRQEVLDAYFSPEGANYTLARTHIASCDFSVASYQYSTEPDPFLSDFSIDHDKELLIPLLKDAVAASGGSLKLIAAPWSAPAWMKDPPILFEKPAEENGWYGVDPSLRKEYYPTYALYLSKYLQAYKAEGLEFWGLSPQNEPLGNGGNWETMRWVPFAMRDFIRDNLGPQLRRDGFSDIKLMIFDHNKGSTNPLAKSDAVLWSEAILADKEAAKYIWGTATHWYASTNRAFEDDLDAIHAIDPTKHIIASEQTIDGLSDQRGLPPTPEYQDSWLKDEWYWTKTAYDWGYWWAQGPAKELHPVYEPVYRYARDIIVGLNHWYVGWIDWNAVLDTTGGPNHQNNLCAAPVMVNTTSKSVYYSPLFYVMSHFSKFIMPQARVLGTKVTMAESMPLTGYDMMPTEGLQATSSRNPDGSVVVVLFNQTAAPVDYTVTLGGHAAKGVIDAQALQTLVWSFEP